MPIAIILLIPMIMFGITWLFFKRKPNTWKAITDNIDKISDYKIKWCIFIFTVLAQGGTVFLRKLPISADEVYTMAGASFFAGNDWSSYMRAKKFYNFGYTMFLAPIYKFFNDPVAVYRAMLFTNILVQAAMIVLVYHIIRKKFACPKTYSIAIAFVSACNALIMVFRGYMYNEIPLAIITWVLVWILLELADSIKGKRIFLSALLGVVAAYAYILHSRCVILYATIAILVLVFLLVYKKWLVQPISFMATFGIGIYFCNMLIDYVKVNLYLKDADAVMKNSVAHVMTGTSKYNALSSLDGIKDVFARFFTLSGALTIETGGLLTIVTVVVLYYVIKRFKKYCKGEESKQIFILTVYSIIALWGMVAAIALVAASNGKFRFVVYSRYFVPFIGPFIALGMILLKKYLNFHYKWIAIWSGVLTLIVIAAYVFSAYPILNGTRLREITSTYFFMAFSLHIHQSMFSKNVFAIALGFLVVFTTILLVLYRKKQLIALCTIVMIFSVSLTLAVEFRQSTPSSRRRYEMSDVSLEVLENTDGLKTKKIFCTGDGRFRKSFLVMAFDDNVSFYTPDIKEDNDIVLFSNKEKYLQKQKVPYIYQLDKNEWIGFWDEKLCESFEE